MLKSTGLPNPSIQILHVRLFWTTDVFIALAYAWNVKMTLKLVFVDKKVLLTHVSKAKLNK